MPAETKCGSLLDPTELKQPRCSTCSSTPEVKETKHLYINLPKISGKLDEWMKKVSVEGKWADNAVNITKAWIRDGLNERAITRDLKWGIPVPKKGYENKVFYVWFNAGYSDEWYGVVCKCARCGAEVCGCDARNYCPNCGYEYKPWDGKIL